jgi:hypothetical protein
MIKSGCIKSSAEHMRTKLQRIVVRVKAVELQLLPQYNRILHLLRVGHVCRRRRILRHGRIRGIRFWTCRLPSAKPLFDHSLRFIGCYIADNNNGCKVGANRRGVILPNARKCHFRQRCRRCLAQGGVACRQQTHVEGAGEPISGALQVARDKLRCLHLCNGKCFLRKSRVQLIICQQLDTA